MPFHPCGCLYGTSDQGRSLLEDPCGFHQHHPKLPLITASSWETALWSGIVMLGLLTPVAVAGWAVWRVARWLLAM